MRGGFYVLAGISVINGVSNMLQAYTSMQASRQASLQGSMGCSQQACHMQWPPHTQPVVRAMPLAYAAAAALLKCIVGWPTNLVLHVHPCRTT